MVPQLSVSLFAVVGSDPLSVMPPRLRRGLDTVSLTWCSRVVAGECCCRVLLPQLLPVVIDWVDEVDGTVVITTHPRARGRGVGGAVGCQRGCTAATDGSWRIVCHA